jgi:cyclopropane fatty-acyl-phospholipid synthase-like methyltransferase
MQLVTGKWVSKALAVVADLGIPDQLKEGARSASDLAARTGVEADALYRLLRATAAVGVLKELPDRRFENNALSSLMRSDVPNSLRAMVRWIGEESAWRAWAGLEYSVRTGQPAFDHVIGSEVFEHFKTHPEAGRIFNDAMTNFTVVTAAAVADAYDFSTFEKIVDVGGGHGALLAAIALKYPTVQGVVFDLAEVVAGATPALSAQGLGGRIVAAGGNFLEGVPEGADAYVMKFIIHDWDDDRARKILSNCRRAMKTGGKVLIIEQVVTDRPEATLSKLSDLEMLVMTPGGRERTEQEFARLIGSAGLRMTRVVSTQSPFCIVEAVSQ